MKNLPLLAALALAVPGSVAISAVTVAPAEAAACVKGVRGTACTAARPVVVRKPVVVAPARRGAVVVR